MTAGSSRGAAGSRGAVRVRWNRTRRSIVEGVVFDPPIGRGVVEARIRDDSPRGGGLGYSSRGLAGYRTPCDRPHAERVIAHGRNLHSGLDSRRSMTRLHQPRRRASEDMRRKTPWSRCPTDGSRSAAPAIPGAREPRPRGGGWQASMVLRPTRIWRSGSSGTHGPLAHDATRRPLALPATPRAPYIQTIALPHLQCPTKQSPGSPSRAR
jgi:hypothetical protein